MQLTMTTSYTLRCILHLPGKEGLSSLPETGEVAGTNKISVQKVLHVLCDAGVISGIHGGTGGYRLAKKLEEIILLNVILLFEKTMRISRCLEPGGYCDRYKTYPVYAYYKEVQKILEDYFGRDTLQDVIDHGERKGKGVIHNAKGR